MARFPLLLCLLIPLASAQQFTISTVAGIGLLPFGGEGAPAVDAILIQPNYVAADSAGNIFVSDLYYQQVFRIAASGTINVYAGAGQAGFSGDGGPATAAQLSAPAGLAFDSAGALYIADSGNSCVRKVSADGTISTVAGNGAAGFTGDGGSATAASLGDPEGLAFDAKGNLYISDASFNVIRMVDANGAISTIAGTGAPDFSGDGGPATAAALNGPVGIKVDTAGNLFVAEQFNERIRKITPQGIISTVAGDGKAGLSGNGGPATAASIFAPGDVALDAGGGMYIADASNNRVRLVDAGGVIQAFAGGGASFQDGRANQADLLLPTSVTIDNAGNIAVALFKGKQVRRMTPQGAITTIAGVVPTTSAGDNIAATSAPLFDPFGIVANGAGGVYVADYTDNRIRKVSASGMITTFAGDGLFATSADNGQAIEVGSPHGLALDGSGNLYVASGSGNIVRRITPKGIVNTVAGGGLQNVVGDGGSALAAQLRTPFDVAVDGAGNLYISEYAGNRIRRVDTQGIITTLAGTGAAGYGGDNGPATSAQLYQPYQIALGNRGNLYFADSGNNCVREISADGTIATVAGNGSPGAGGDGGAAADAQLSGPTGVAVDAAGNLYIADYGNSTIRLVNAATGIMTTIAGTGNSAFSGDGGPATAAELNGPLSLALDGSGNLYFTDELNYRVRVLTPIPSAP